jgi:hypothetical protein
MNKKEKSKKRIGPGLALGLAAPTAALAATLRPTAKAILGDVDKFLGQKTTKVPKDVQKIMDSFIKKHKLENVKVFTNPLKMDASTMKSTTLMGPNYNALKKQVNTFHPTKDYIMLHELGHAKSLKRFTKAKLALRAGGWLGAPIAATALFADDDKRKYAPLAPVAGFTPSLAEEANASRLALKHIKDVKGKKEAWKAAKPLARAFGTQAAIPAILGGTILAMSKLYDKSLKKQEQQEKLREKNKTMSKKAEYVFEKLAFFGKSKKWDDKFAKEMDKLYADHKGPPPPKAIDKALVSSGAPKDDAQVKDYMLRQWGHNLATSHPKRFGKYLKQNLEKDKK